MRELKTFIIINQTGDRAWGTFEDGSGPEHWVEDSQCATVYYDYQINAGHLLPFGGRWISTDDPAADFGP